jgi:putative endonuclease
LVFQQDFHFVQQAIAFEKQVKGWSRKKKEALIAGEIDLQKILAICTNESHLSNKKDI